MPSDGTDEEIDTNGTIADTIEAAQRWFETQTGGKRLRFDTFQGEYDVTFFQLPQTDAKMASYGERLRDRLEYEVLMAGFDTNKMHAVFYGGLSKGIFCGKGPLTTGNVVAMFLQVQDRCANLEFVFPSGEPGAWGYVTLHELIHGLDLFKNVRLITHKEVMLPMTPTI